MCRGSSSCVPSIRDGASQPLNNWNDLMEGAALEEDPTDDQPQEEECDMLTHQSTDSSMREKAAFPRLDHLLVRLVVRTTHQGHVAFGEAPPLAPRNRAPKAEVEAVEGGAEEGPTVPNSPK